MMTMIMMVMVKQFFYKLQLLKMEDFSKALQPPHTKINQKES